MPGLIHIYCGEGKGKTTAAIGLAVRCAGSGRKVLILQFLKDGKSSEFAALSHVPGIEAVPQTKTFGFTWTLTPEEKQAAAAYYTSLLEDAFCRAGDFDLLILDEVLGLVDNQIITIEELKTLLEARNEETDVILTGVLLNDEICMLADEVTRVESLKYKRW